MGFTNEDFADLSDRSYIAPTTNDFFVNHQFILPETAPMQTPKLAAISIFLLTLSILVFGIERSRVKAIAEVPQPSQFAPVLGCKLQPSANPPNP